MTSVFSWQNSVSFALLHFVLQSETFLLIQISLEFLLLNSVPYDEKDFVLLLLLSFQCHICLSFHTVSEVLKARILKWFPIPFSNGPHLSDFSFMTRPSWMAPHGMA